MLGIITERTERSAEHILKLATEGAILDAAAAEQSGFVKSVENLVVPDDAEMIHIFPIQKVE